ncbi:MAG: hypothetical protein Q9207_002486 [Kuettlingeria erythrocarpa]
MSKAAPPCQPIASTPREDREEVLDTTDSGLQLQTTRGLQETPSPHPTLDLPHPAKQDWHFTSPSSSNTTTSHREQLPPPASNLPHPATRPHDQHFTSPHPSGTPSTSHQVRLPHPASNLPRPTTQPQNQHSTSLAPSNTASTSRRGSVPRPTGSQPHPTTKPHNQHTTIPPPSNTPSTSQYSSVQAWIDQALQVLPTTEVLAAPQPSGQCDREDNRLKRKRSASSDQGKSAHTIPLTRNALKQHLALTMSSDQSTLVDNVFTPSKTAQTTDSALETPSNVTKPSLKHNDVRRYMEQHGIYVNTNLLDKPEFAGFRDLVMSVADTQRPSGRKPESERRWQKRTENLETRNEATMLDHILPMVIKNGRQVPTHGTVTQKTSSAYPQPDEELEDFEESGMGWSVDREFSHSFLPNSYTDVGYEEKISKALAKDHGIKNPKPDRAYGFAVKSIPPPEGRAALLRDQTEAILNAVPTLQHVFFLIEAVSSGGNIAKTINQACRGGTVAVVIQRLLLEAIGQLWMDAGPDRQTYVYTATMDSSLMTFWVNFANVRVTTTGAKIVSYHMEHVFTYAYRSKDALVYLRAVCHNILDWGVRTRRPTIEARVARLYESERLAIQADAAKAKELAEKAREAQEAAAAAAVAEEQGQGGKGKGKKRKLALGAVSRRGF